MNLFLHPDFSRIPTAYRQACFAISCHAYRFMHIILQTWTWLKSNSSTILVMGNNDIVQCKLTFVQASCFINGISDNTSILVWKTISFLQTCATREYDVIIMLVLLISSQSLNLGGRRGHDVATIPFHPSLSSAALRESPNPIPVHSLVWSSHLSFCLPLLLAPFTVPCRIVFAMLEDFEMWPYHLSFRFLTWLGDHHALQLHSGFFCEPPRSSHGLCRKCSEVSYSISSQGLVSFSRFLLSRSSCHRHKGR